MMAWRLVLVVVVRHHDVKTVTEDWLKRITPISIAYWFMDDGSLSVSDYTGDVSSITFHTEGFSRSENRLLQKCLKSFDVDAEVKYTGDYYYLYLPRQEACTLMDLVRDSIHSSMKYKRV